MKEQPLSFGTWAIPKLLDGSKTMTRRPLKGLDGSPWETSLLEAGRWREAINIPDEPGDIYWVKETYGLDEAYCEGAQYKANWKVEDHKEAEWTDWKWKSSRFMPKKYSRITLELLKPIRIERLQSIADEDIVREGMTLETATEVFSKAAGKVRWEYERWLLNEETGAETFETYCPKCADKKVKKLGRPWIVDGWNEYFEQDGPRWCDGCHVLLCHSLTDYGVETELEYLSPVSGESASILHNLAQGIGDLQPKHHPSLFRIAFATLWNSIYGKGAWDANPFVKVIGDFRRIKP